MKRSFVIALIIGSVVAAIVIALHATGVLFGLELAASNVISHFRTTTRSVGNFWQYGAILLFAVGVS